MIQLSIENTKIENFFNSSKDEIMKALKFIVDNDIHDFSPINNTSDLSEEQKKELAQLRNKLFNSFTAFIVKILLLGNCTANCIGIFTFNKNCVQAKFFIILFITSF